METLAPWPAPATVALLRFGILTWRGEWMFRILQVHECEWCTCNLWCILGSLQCILAVLGTNSAFFCCIREILQQWSHKPLSEVQMHSFSNLAATFHHTKCGTNCLVLVDLAYGSKSPPNLYGPVSCRAWPCAEGSKCISLSGHRAPHRAACLWFETPADNAG